MLEGVAMNTISPPVSLWGGSKKALPHSLRLAVGSSVNAPLVPLEVQWSAKSTQARTGIVCSQPAHICPHTHAHAHFNTEGKNNTFLYKQKKKKKRVQADTCTPKKLNFIVSCDLHRHTEIKGMSKTIYF